MSDLPILFSGPMVRALLAGTKTQTRRLLDSWCEEPPAFVQDGVITAYDENDKPYRWPHTKALGDRLYVREHWRTESLYPPHPTSDATLDAFPPRDLPQVPVIYEADADWSDNKSVGRFRQGMHMPRWASRITLHVTEVRVQRLQDISEQDALAEGIRPMDIKGCPFGVELNDGMIAGGPSARSAYHVLWATVNGEENALMGQDSWAKNPWVSATTFVVERCNIAQASRG